MNHKPLFLATALIALLVIAGAFCWMSQRQPVAVNQSVVTDPVVEVPVQAEPETTVVTSDWKTYRNEEYGFEMKYPIQFKLDDKPIESGRVAVLMEFDESAKSLDGQNNPGYFPVISIYQWKDINDSDLKGGSWEGEKIYKNFQDFLADSEHTSINVTNETSIDGRKAYVLSMPGGIGYEAIMFEHAGSYYRVSFPWTQKPLDEGIKKHFLSLIKLTE